MDLGLRDRVVAVTGAASGIGRACALAAAAEGAHVAALDVADAGATCREAEALGVRTLALTCDVRDGAAVAAAFDRAAGELGGLDGLVNAAGTMGNWPRPLAETSDADFDLVVDTNLRGVFACCRAALPALRRRRGAIVNVASELALVGLSGLAVYGAAKAGIVQLSRTLAVEESAKGVRVNCVCPGPVDTPFLLRPGGDPDADRERAAGPTLLGRLATPAEIGDTILFTLSPRAGYTTGAVIVVDGGVTAKSR